MADSYENLKNELDETLEELDMNELYRMKRKVFELFRDTFGKEYIDQLTSEKVKGFFKTINELIKTGVKYNVALNDFSQFKKGVKYLLYDDDPVKDRINNTLHYDQKGEYPYKIIGMQRSPTILLNLSDPNNFCIWNHNTQQILFDSQLIDPINDSWLMYERNNNLQKKLASDLCLDLFTLDYLMRYHHKKIN
jgi:hypothetical protein